MCCRQDYTAFNKKMTGFQEAGTHGRLSKNFYSRADRGYGPTKIGSHSQD